LQYDDSCLEALLTEKGSHSMSFDVPLAVNCSILFQELPLLQRPAAAKAAGFDAVEFWWPFSSASPASTDVDAFADAILAADVRLIGLNFAAGDMPNGDRGLVSWPGRQAEFRDSVEAAIAVAGRLGTRTFNALYGNRVAGTDPTEQDALGIENLSWAAQRVATIGGTVLLEPVSGAANYPLLTAQQVIAVIDKVGAPNMCLLADFYHLAGNGDDVGAAIAAYGARIGHIQVADAPGRHRPGTGELPLADWVAAAVSAGYDGYVALEYAPVGDTATDLAEVGRSMKLG